ncbi:lipid-A-disaccharide synthase-related protein [Deinococcus sp.]|uniref:lipid-A-disaccharide synthase-related protein n=1 Tax=Deinococcus sp. TaxID=47478 RepID=UPI0025DAEFC2|nr:lipid-A-disaccharide synthase-related protein [Deinococcus sp.]
MPASPQLLLLSNGAAEDLIGARLLSLTGRPASVLPLVGAGRAYRSVPDTRLVGPPLELPSGGFPFGSGANLRSDVQAGLISASLRQWAAAFRAARTVAAVVVVGDAYALGIGWAAAARAGAPLIHLQPLLSAHYTERLGLRGALSELNALGANIPMPYELSLARRAHSVFVRDHTTADYYAARGVAARWVGSFAMDVLPAAGCALPEAYLAGRPVLALLPGSRADHRGSLPLMLEAAARLPDLAALVAWPHDWQAVTLPHGWTLDVHDEHEATAGHGGAQVRLLRGAFGAIARRADLAIGTSGTANEQLAGLGVPVIGFATAGPQYTAGFARRQARLLGQALTLTEPRKLVEAVQALRSDGARRARAAHDGISRIGPAGALGVVAGELQTLLGAAYPL